LPTRSHGAIAYVIMKIKLISHLTACVLVLLAAGCDREKPESFKWPHVNPEVDSLSRRLDSLYYHRAQVGQLDTTLLMLREAAQRANPSYELQRRLAFFNAIVENRHPGPNSAIDTIRSIREKVDSTAHPYLFNRASQIVDMTLPVSVETFDLINARIKYFESIHDTYLTAEHHMSLGVLLKNVKDYPGAFKAYNMADSLFNVAGYPDMAAQNMINIANLYYWQGDSAKSVQTMHKAIADSTVHRIKARVGAAWYNLALHYDDEAALDSMLAIGYTLNKGRQYTLRAKRSYRHGDNQNAALLADTALRIAQKAGDPHGLWFAYRAGAAPLAALGRNAEAYDWLNRSVTVKDSVEKIEEHDNIRILETGRQIAIRRMEHELERSRRTLVWVCVAFGMFLILVAAAWIVALRMRRLKRQKAEASRERDRVSQELIATKIAMDETQQLISSVGKEIGDMADEGRLPDGETRRIVSVIKSHNTRQSQRESFVDTFGQVHPGFAHKLRELNDSITEQDIRIAMYVATGIDSKQIASSIGIRPESVKQARWRLRTKLSLAKGESLDKYLQDLLLE